MGISWWGMRESKPAQTNKATSTNNQPLTALSPVPGFANFDYFKLNAEETTVLRHAIFSPTNKRKNKSKSLRSSQKQSVRHPLWLPLQKQLQKLNHLLRKHRQQKMTYYVECLLKCKKNHLKALSGIAIYRLCREYTRMISCLTYF